MEELDGPYLLASIHLHQAGNPPVLLPLVAMLQVLFDRFGARFANPVVLKPEAPGVIY